MAGLGFHPERSATADRGLRMALKGRGRGAAVRGRWLLLGWLLTASALALPPWHLDAPPPPGTEALHYRLAYRGVLTLFVWKQLAEVRLSARPVAGACELELRLSTERHTLAEAVRPTRYRWWSRSSAGLERVKAVAIADLGARELEGRLLLLHWQQGWLDDFKANLKPPPVDAARWQPLVKGRPHPALAHRRRKPLPPERLLDPLGFVQHARWHDYRQGPLEMMVLYKAKRRRYRARLLERTRLRLGEREVPAFKVEMSRSRPGEARREGFMQVWFSDDERRLPLRFVIEGRVGSLRVALVPDDRVMSPPPSVCRPAGKPG